MFDPELMVELGRVDEKERIHVLGLDSAVAEPPGAETKHKQELI